MSAHFLTGFPGANPLPIVHHAAGKQLTANPENRGSFRLRDANTPEFGTTRRGDKNFPSFPGIELSGLTKFLARTVFGGAVPGLMSLR